MAEHDDDETPASSDPDRAAILARRQRFVALALSGLATTACTDGKSGDADKPDAKVDSNKADEAPPQPCLSALPPQPQPQPQSPKVCLKIAAPRTDSGSSDSGESESESESESETGAPPPPKPQPCLSKTAPQPCLRKAPPQPCLKAPPPKDDGGDF